MGVHTNQQPDAKLPSLLKSPGFVNVETVRLLLKMRFDKHTNVENVDSYHTLTGDAEISKTRATQALTKSLDNVAIYYVVPENISLPMIVS